MKFDVYNKFFIVPFISFIVLVMVGFLTFIFIKTTTDDSIYEWNPKNSNVNVKFYQIDGKNVQMKISRGNEQVQTIIFGTKFSNPAEVKTTEGSNSISLQGDDTALEINFDIDTTNYIQFHVSNILLASQSVMDCFLLDTSNLNWFGGPEQKYQYWPVQTQFYDNNAYLSKELDSAGISERYWLTSKGLFVYISELSPLFIHQNSDNSRGRLCFEAKRELPFFVHDSDDTTIFLNYTIGIGINPRAAHMEVVERFFKKPTGIPTEQMIRYPIWSTWVRYGRDIDEQVIRDFADEIIAHGFKHSHIDIDDLWESCYGSMKLAADKFGGMKTLTDDLHAMGMDTTIWIHPFINKNCIPYYEEAIAANYLVKSHSGSYDTRWWNSNDLDEAAYIDFTNPAAIEFFRQNLRQLQIDSGVDGFKFDAGETSWTPDDPILQGSTDLYPSQVTLKFLEAVEEFPNLVEIRVGQGTQNLPFFVRMLDLDSRWGWNNGLVTLIPTLLQMNLAGYVFVLPDMIGGNRYGTDDITEELFIRWMQATALMPAMQFSVTPWDYSNETIQLGLEFTQLHERYSDMIIERFELATITGEPVNPPIWWIDPTDWIAYGINDEFLLGVDVLVAPVVQPNQRTRDIYLPRGKWLDENTGDTHVGPTWLEDYAAPLEILPYFIRTEN